jgi:hypothetical protein
MWLARSAASPAHLVGAHNLLLLDAVGSLRMDLFVVPLCSFIPLLYADETLAGN